MRELVWMGQGAWGQTSEVLAMLANGPRDTKKFGRLFEGADFNPMVPRKSKRDRKAAVMMGLRAMLGAYKKKGGKTR